MNEKGTDVVPQNDAFRPPFFCVAVASAAGQLLERQTRMEDSLAGNQAVKGSTGKFICLVACTPV
jgi:hypothetical protein